MTDAPIDTRLGDFLVRVLLDHGVAARQDGEVVRVGDDGSRWVRLLATREGRNARLVRLQVDAEGPGGVVLSDAVVGVGRDAEEASADALQQFCGSDFHVLLAGLWGVLEEDQVEHRVVATEHGSWDVYFGGWVSRWTASQDTFPCPGAAFVANVVEASPEILVERRAHVGRIFVAANDERITYEALLDMEPNERLDGLLRSVPLAPRVSGFVSHRLFFLAVPRDDGPTHTRVGRCSQFEVPRKSSSNVGRWVALAAVSIGLAYALLR